MDKRSDTSLFRQSSEVARNININLLETIIDARDLSVRSAGGHNMFGLIVLANEVDDDVTACH